MNRSGVTCSDCHEELVGDNYINPPATRLPCPKCGSMNRTVALSGMTLGMSTGTAMLSVQSAGSGIVLPPILVQAVVERQAQTQEGDLVVALVPAWTAIVAALQKDPAVAFEIDPRKWEEILAGAYELAGFDEVILTPRSGDLGRDVIATKKGFLTVRIIEQVKRYASGNLVPASDVRALCGTLNLDSRASKGLVTTTSDFAPGCAKEFASLIPTRLELVNGQDLKRRLAEIAAGTGVLVPAKA
jgi:restriction system protein